MSGDGGPAFPVLDGSERWTDEDGVRHTSFAHLPGMTLRDYFAGQALAGMLARNASVTAAEDAYKYADAMLRARETRP